MWKIVATLSLPLSLTPYLFLFFCVSGFVLIFEIVWHLSGKVLPGGSQCLVMIEQPAGKRHEKLQLQCQNRHIPKSETNQTKRYPVKYLNTIYPLETS